jgi:hypothetical protein
MTTTADSRRRFMLGNAIALPATLFFVAWLGFGIGGEDVVRWVDDLGTFLAALMAAVLCFRAGRQNEHRVRVFWLLMAGASGAWAVAEAIWGVYDAVLLEEVPVPSLADVVYLAGIPLAIAALVCHPAMRARGSRRARSILDGLVLATSLLFLSWSLVLGPLWHESDLSTSGGIVALAYPFGDIIIVFFIVLAMRGISGGNRLPLWCLLGGLLAMAVSDSVYAYLTEVKSYETGSLLDAGWFVAYVGLALGAFSSNQSIAVEKHESSQPTIGQLVVPFLPVLVALSVTAIQIELGHRLHDANWLIAFALIVLVLVRQGMLVLDLMTSDGEEHVTVVERLQHTALGLADPRTHDGVAAGAPTEGSRP